MFVLVAGGGKVGANLTRALCALGHEVSVIEQDRRRYERIEAEFEHRAVRGDATELYILEQAGIRRPPQILVAATGDDEDNIVICQVAQQTYGVPKVVARVNDPRNERHFELLGIGPTVSPTRAILALIEHEVPEHELVPLLELKREHLEIVEVELDEDACAIGKRVERLRLPETARLIAVVRDGRARIALDDTELRAGDQVLIVLEPGTEEELRTALLAPARSFPRL